MKKPSAFKQTDISRAVEGVVAGGVPVEMVEVSPDGSIRVFAKINVERIVFSEADAIDAALREMEHGAN